MELGADRLPAVTLAPPLLEGVGLHKRFPGVHALKGVDFAVQRGRVHALVGENGAGKSTLVKVLSGVYAPDEGHIRVDGEAMGEWTARSALAAGISTIYQEFNLVPHQTVAENVFLGREPPGPWGRFRNPRELRRRTAELLARLHVDIAPGQTVARLGVAQRQVVEIAKALSLGTERVLILDEPTAALSPREAEQLFAIIRRLTADGVGILYISHRLDEVTEIGDQVTVMRDGAVSGSRPAAEAEQRTIIKMMVGRELADFFVRAPSHELGPPALQVRDLTAPDVVDASLEVRSGEVVGLFGLIGAGRTELVLAVMGARPVTGGSVEVRGKLVVVGSPARAVKLGLGIAPEDRKRSGIVPERSVRENIVLSALPRLSRGGWLIQRTQVDETARQYVERLRIKTPGLDTPIASLSGGTQQKVILARLLAARADVIIFDEPTRGIDVGAKREVYELISELAAQGTAILVVSSDLDEALGLADRIVIMRQGRTVAGFRGPGTEREVVLAAAFPDAAAVSDGR